MMNGHNAERVMLPVSTRQLDRFKLPGTEEQEGAAVFLLAIPTVFEKMDFRRAVAAHGSRYPQDAEMLACLRDAVRGCVVPDDQAPLLELIDQCEGAAAEEDKASLRADCEGVAQRLRRHWPALDGLRADREHFIAVAPLVAAQTFLRGWENLDLAFERRGGLLPDALLEQLVAKLGDSAVSLIGFRAMALLEPSADVAKNSASPSRSPSTPPATPADPTPSTAAPDGTSAASATAAIPGSN